MVVSGVVGIWWGGGHDFFAMNNDLVFPRQREREEMVASQIEARGITNKAVISAMKTVPRHQFIPDQTSKDAYGDFPLPIGFGQTISQPFIVAFMTQALKLHPGDKVLEIGTGSGYQAAILAELGAQVFTIEIVEALATRAKQTLEQLGYHGVHVRAGDGYQGWPEESPFDAIILTAAPKHIPGPLLEQIAMEGHLLLPVGDYPQKLLIIERTEDGYRHTELLPVAFVPMTGEVERHPSNSEP